jgi:hypothetical protein
MHSEQLVRRLTVTLTGALLLAACIGMPLLAQPVAAGKTIMARGTVEALAEQQRRALQRQSPVYAVDLVTTGPVSASQLRMSDGGLLSLQADTELAIRDYRSDPAQGNSQVSLELVKGGLRTITGVLPTEQKNYRLKTPVATIGVRGTHYEAVLKDGDLYLAGWDGVIDVAVTVPGVSNGFSLGPTEAYRFAIVRANGQVELVLRPPFVFSGTPAQPLLDNTNLQTDITAGTAAALSGSMRTSGGFFSAVDWIVGQDHWAATRRGLNVDAGGMSFYGIGELSANWSLQGMDSVGRSGTVSFDFINNHSLVSSSGLITDLSMSMLIDFDGAWVPEGQLSFTDNGGEWFAVFNGLISGATLDLQINFASHGNNLAQGSISGLLLDDASRVLGNLQLTELDDPAVRIDGGFELTEQP